MQTQPVIRLPVDPSPRAAQADTIDRGFADLLTDKARRAAAEDRGEPARTQTREVTREHPAEPRDDAAVRAADETPERDNDDGADRAMTEPGRADDENVGADVGAETEAEVDAAAVSDAAAAGTSSDAPPTASLWTDPSITPAAVPGSAGNAPIIQGQGVTLEATVAGVGPAGESIGAAGGQNGATAGNPGNSTNKAADGAQVATPAQPTASAAAPDAAETVSAETVSAETEAADGATPPATENDPSAADAAADETGRPATAGQALQPAAPAAPATPSQPMPTAEQTVTTTQPQAAAAKPAGGARPGDAAGDAPASATPATPAQPDGAAADAGASGEEGEFRPAAAASAQTARSSGGSPDGKPDAAAGNPGTAQKADGPAQAANAAPAAPDAAAAVAGPADRGADAPGQSNNSGLPHQTVSATGDARAPSGALPTADSAAPRAPANPAASQVAIHINRAVQDGQDRFTVNLKPANLGKITVNLELGHDHRVIAVISADRPDTLDLLQRDARTLERALQDAGLKTDSGSLSFSLQGDGTNRSPGDDEQPAGRYAAFSRPGEGDDPLPAVGNPYARAVSASGVDIHV